jgi:hypothetical protein
VAFDKQMRIELRVEHPEQPRAVTVRWPTDDEWKERAKRFRLERRVTAGGAWSETTNELETERWLFDQIVLSQAPALSDAEAAEVIGRLERVTANDCQRGDDGAFQVELGIPSGLTVHRLRTPTAEERYEFNKGQNPPVDLGRGRSLILLDSTPADQLYNAVFLSAAGYAGEGAEAVPVIHKAAAVRVLLAELENRTGSGF